MKYLVVILLSLLAHDEPNVNQQVNCDNCRTQFLKSRLEYNKGHSFVLYLPAYIGTSKVRIAINSENLHRYLTSLKASKDSIEKENYLLPTLEYQRIAFDYFSNKDTLQFNPQYFEMYMGHSDYTVLDKENPYEMEIKKDGLAAFCEKRLIVLKESPDRIIYKLNLMVGEYDNYDSYNLIYLYEALFNNDIGYGGGDGDIIFMQKKCLN